MTELGVVSVGGKDSQARSSIESPLVEQIFCAASALLYKPDF
jgi:hypothetical protein